ncbi:MAG: hypothetical protein EA424_15210 [Planctomycetaceae bacterium]|nr:MAG: hypothetical protein EA424_15210 [Planctomycetaceae bacterium]
MSFRKLFDRIISGKKISTSRRTSHGRKIRRAAFRDRLSSSRQFEVLEDRRLLVVGAFAIPAAVAPDFSGVVFLGASPGGCGGTLLDSGLHVLTAAHCLSNNESQIVDLGSPTGGTFTLTFEDQTTADIAFDATAGDIRAALESLPNIDQVAVFADPDGDPATADFRVEFRGNLALTDVDQMTGDGSNLVGGSLTITTDRDGRLAETTTVGFDVDDGVGAVTTFSIPAAVTVHPSYNGNTRDGNDITMLRLERVGTFAADRHPIYRDSDEVGQNFTVVGYGHTGTGADGRDETSGGTKRSAMNTWDALGDILAMPPVSSFNLPAGTTLTYDFDNSNAPAADDDPANTTDFFGFHYNILHNGLGADEGMQSAGDSGGPALIGNAVSGVVSFSRQRLGSPPDVDDDGNNSFGEYAVMTRVSAFQGWIDGWVADPGPVVIDMTDQVGGNDGVPDEIRLVLNGTDLEIHYNGTLVNTSAFAAVTSIEVRGSDDDDILIVDNTGGLVIPTGGIVFHGNGEVLGDSLRVIGDGTHTGDYTPDETIDGNGVVTVNGGTITFTGLEPVEISGMASFTFITPNDADVLTIEDAIGSGGEDAIQITGTSGGVGFEVPTFFDVATVIVDASSNHAADAMDKVTVNVTIAPQGISNLVIETGDGDDGVCLQATTGFNTHVDTGDGQDLIVVFDTAQTVHVNGGPPDTFPGDRLAFPDGAAGNFMSIPNGSATLPGGGQVNWVNIEEIVAPDRFEPNDSLIQATVLGSAKWMVERGLSIHSADDEDWFRVTAHDSGVLQVNLHHLWAEDRNLALAIFDADGDLIAEVDTQTDNEFLAIPVVAQQRYHLRVSGSANGNAFCAGPFVNYSLEVENTPLLAAPAGMHMDPASDTGVLNNDLVTADPTPTFFVEARMERYTDPNNDGLPDIDLLTPAQAAAGDVPGFAILVTISDSDTGDTVTGYATQVGNSRLFRFTPAADLPDAVYFVSAAIQVFDGSTPTINDEGPSTHPLWVTIDTEPPTGTVPDLLASSDSGMLDNDHVTNIQAPAFQGTGEPNALVRILADGVIIGQGTVTSDGLWEVTVEPLRDGQYEITAQFEDAAGNISDPTPAMVPDLVIDTAKPNTPYLDLQNDTGRSDTDNVTQENLLQFLMVGNDTLDGNGNPAPHDVIYRLYWRPGDAAGEVLVYDSWTEFADFTTLGQLTRTVSQDLNDPNGTPLPDGLHNFKLEVEDRAGNLSHDFLLTVVVDVVPYLGAGDLHPDSDSGVPGYLATREDRITNVQTPSFFGTAEANNMVTAVINGVPAGTTIAVPLDGNDAFQPPNAPYQGVEGNWRIDTNLLLADGQHSVVFVFEDLAGNRIQSDPLLLFVDTQGPQITAIEINEVDHPYNLFDPKSDLPPVGGPTPLVESLVISVRDLPLRTDDFPYDAVFVQTATHPGHYLLVGDHNGTIAIESVTFTSVNDGPGLATGYLTLNFLQPLPDDRFTLTVSDAITDIAGNALDGESNAMEPNGAPQFPTGDGQPGGSFVARFTVDSRAEIGVWAAGSVYVDTNGNFIHDPTGKDGDFTNRDITYMFGLASDHIIAGNFVTPADPGDPANQADGFHKLAAYGRYGGANRWLIDTDNNGVPNLNLPDGLSIDGLPLAGRFWDGVVRNGIDIDPNSDQVGVKQGTSWYLDTNANLIIDAADVVLAGNMPGMPIVGDFDGDGIDDLGSWVNDVFYLNLSTMLTGEPNLDSYHPNINGIWDMKFEFGFTGVRERPFAADFDGDGFDDIGLWVPDRSGATPAELAEWYILTSGGSPLTDRIDDSMVTAQPTVHFTPRPFGPDIYAQFGDNFALPVVGNFDPPVVPLSGKDVGPMTDTNPNNPLDVNGDGIVSPLDVLIVINTINHHDQYIAQGAFAFSNGIFPDVNGDSFITPLDALLLINHINRNPVAGVGAEGEFSMLQATLAVSDLDVPVASALSAASIESLSVVDSSDRIVTSVIPSADWPGVQVTASEADTLFARVSESQDRDYSGREDEEDEDDLFDDLAHDVDLWWHNRVGTHSTA